MRKRSTIFTLIALIILGILTYWQYNLKSKTNHENTNINNNEVISNEWRTYRNETIGLEFEYPASWPIINSENKGDDNTDSFATRFINNVTLLHTFIDYDYKNIEEQYEIIKCKYDTIYVAFCEDRKNPYGTKYIWYEYYNTIGDFDPETTEKMFYAYIPTGKYILSLSFGSEKNYNLNVNEYKHILDSIKIVE